MDKWLEKKIESMSNHIEVLNKEHGDTRDKVIRLEKVVENVCKKVDELGSRVWNLLVGTILGFVITIFLLVLNIFIGK